MKQTKLFKQERIQFLNSALLIDESILVLGDFHIGLEESIVEKGIFPRIQLSKITSELSKIFNILEKRKIKLEKIIILGDLKHEFGEISEAEWNETIYLLNYLIKKCKNIILIKGNHDNILGPIANKKPIKLMDFYQHKDIIFMHGHKLHPDSIKTKNSKILILGHLHPSITLSDDYKREKYKCFLKGKYKRKQVYILPSFNPIAQGYDLNQMDLSNKNFTIIENKKLKDFDVIIYNNKEDKPYNFGKLKTLI